MHIPVTRPPERVRKPILGALRPGIELMIDTLPVQPENRADVRGWTLGLTASASAWEVNRAMAGRHHADRRISKDEAALRLGQALAQLRQDGAL